MSRERKWENKKMRSRKGDHKSRQVSLNVTERNGRWITNTLSGVEGVASLDFPKSCKFSNIALERSEPGYAI